MIDFARLENDEMTLQGLADGLTVADLRHLTNEMADLMFSLIEGCTDEDVTFQPSDPGANDPYASVASEVNIPWTLGHIIVHSTASSEEAAAVAAELARGVDYHGRSRSEIPWEQVTTIRQCRERLEESRRMRLASLEMWPDAPYLDNRYEPWAALGSVNAVARFIMGLWHDTSHLEQLREVVRQANTARVVN